MMRREITVRRFVCLLLMFVFLVSAVAFAEGNEWVCPDCGAGNTMNFCIKCGAKRPEDIVCPDCGTKYDADSGAVFCGNCGAKLQEDVSLSVRYEGEGFATPEEALTCYMEGLRNLDFEQMLSAFAWETQMEHYSFQKHFERVLTYNSSMRPRMPSVNDFMFSANVNILRSYQTDMIYHALEEYILVDDAPLNTAKGTIIFQKDSDEVEEFLKKFDNGRLEKLTQMTNIRFLQPDEITDHMFSTERNQVNFARQTACYGADEAVNLVGVASVGNETLYCFPTICRYGDKWYLVSVSSMTSMILGIATNRQAFICGTGTLEEIIR